MRNSNGRQWTSMDSNGSQRGDDSGQRELRFRPDPEIPTLMRSIAGSGVTNFDQILSVFTTHNNRWITVCMAEAKSERDLDDTQEKLKFELQSQIIRDHASSMGVPGFGFVFLEKSHEAHGRLVRVYAFNDLAQDALWGQFPDFDGEMVVTTVLLIRRLIQELMRRRRSFEIASESINEGHIDGFRLKAN